MYTLEQTVDLLNKMFDYTIPDYDAIWEFVEKHNFNFQSGETRFCLYDPKWDFVIKLARFDNVEDDYNAIELANYEEAKRRNIHRILLPIQKVATLKSGIGVYVQKRYTTSHGCMDYKQSDKIAKKTATAHKSRICKDSKSKVYQGRRIAELWYERAYQIYGKKFMREFEKFTQDLKVGDLHSENVGWLKNQPIILDFAGYHG